MLGGAFGRLGGMIGGKCQEMSAAKSPARLPSFSELHPRLRALCHTGPQDIRIITDYVSIVFVSSNFCL